MRNLIQKKTLELFCLCELCEEIRMLYLKLSLIDQFETAYKSFL